MSRSLPERPSLEFLKKSAKQRLRVLREGEPRARLADAQLAVAREYGFASWRKLRERVEGVGAAASGDRVRAFVEAALVPADGDHREGTLDRAEALLMEEPGIAGADLYAACVLGDAKWVGRMVEGDPKLARRAGGPRNWPPLLYVCYSRYLRDRRKEREAGFVRAARILVEHGADPNSMYVHEGFNETALYGAAGVAGAPGLTRFLLGAGADPNDRQERDGSESLYHACEHRDNACLRMILEAGPRRSNASFCLARKLDFEDVEGVRLMLDHGADPNFTGPTGETRLVHAVRRGRGAEILELLIARGADVNAANVEGMTALRLARRRGHAEAVACLRRHGAVETADAREDFLAACAAGDRRAAKRILRAEPGLVGALTAGERRVLPDAAAGGRGAAVRLMVELGFDINAKGDWGGPTVQQAAGVGDLTMVRYLIRRGADLRVKNDYGGDALGAALYWTLHGDQGAGGTAVVTAIARAMEPADVERHLRRAEAEGDVGVVEILKKAVGRRRGA
jgi:ankyrin repeat protein